MRKTALGLCLLCGPVLAQGGSHWLAHHYDILHQQLTCKESEPLNDKSPCNLFVSNVLQQGWQLKDFVGVQGHLSANQIQARMAASAQWRYLGQADSQAALERAQRLANEGLPVLAVSAASGHGHVALVIPGKLSHSGAWSLRVPNSASFRFNRPDLSYVGKPLSFAWAAGDKGDVELYFRKL